VSRLAACRWPSHRLAEAIALLVREGGFADTPLRGQEMQGGACEGPEQAAVLGAALGISTESFEWRPSASSAGLLARVPAVLWTPQGAASAAAFVAVVRASRRSLDLLAPDGHHTRVTAAELAALTEDQQAAGGMDAIFEAAGLAGPEREAARRALFREGRIRRSAGVRGVSLRLPPGAPLGRQALHAGLGRALGELLALQVMGNGLFLLAFFVVGRAALQGRLETGWLAAFALLLLTLVPVTAMASWRQGLLAIGAGALLRRRLLQGALRLSPEEMREAGAGQLLGRVLESANVETLALAGGFQALLSLVDLAMAALVLGNAPGGGILLSVLAGWVGLVLVFAWRLHRLQGAWTEARVHMSERTVERLVGHRTRLAQEAPG
jgi:ATP-binding cassette subfamily B protein